MAITPAHLITEADTSITTTYVTASITPTANALVLLAVNAALLGSSAEVPASVTGCGLTWVLVDDQIWNDDDTQKMRVCLYRAMGASPSTGAVTITYTSSHRGAVWSISEYTGTDTTGTNGSGAIGQTVTSFQDAVDATLDAVLGSALATGSVTYGAGANDVGATESFSTPTNHTILGQAGHGAPTMRIQSSYRTDLSQTMTQTWTTTAEAGLIAAEIKVAGSGVTTSLSAAGALQEMCANRALDDTQDFVGSLALLAATPGADAIASLTTLGATSHEIVGAINELASTSGLELDEAVRAWAASGNF